MTEIVSNIGFLKAQIPSTVKLIAVSKTRPVNEILEAYNAGQRDFGENRVQELLNKKDFLPNDIEWHLIGHLQTNKVRYIVPFIGMIHSVDSGKLLHSINTEAGKINRVIDCLLQMHIASEETKFGFSMAELNEIFESHVLDDLQFVRICGVMGMATFTSDSDLVRSEFHNLADYFYGLKNRYFSGDAHFREISMGMSGDYKIAISEGTTMLRIGSLVFGNRLLKNNIIT